MYSGINNLSIKLYIRIVKKPTGILGQVSKNIGPRHGARYGTETGDTNELFVVNDQRTSKIAIA